MNDDFKSDEELKNEFLESELDEGCDAQSLYDSLITCSQDLNPSNLLYALIFMKPHYGNDEKVMVSKAEVLVKHGADLDITGYAGETILMMAVGRNDTVMAEFLIEQGSKLEIQDDDGRNVLHYACNESLDGMVSFCLARGMDPNTPDASGRTPLHVVFSPWQIDFGVEELSLTELLLSHGASVNARDKDGATALHLFGRKHHFITTDREKVLKLFLEAGADPFSVANDGSSPWRLAVEQENTEVLDAFREVSFVSVGLPPPDSDMVSPNVIPDTVVALTERTGRDWRWCQTAFGAFHVAAVTDDGPAMLRWLKEFVPYGDDEIYYGHPLQTWLRSDGLNLLQAAAADGHINVVRAIIDFDNYIKYWVDEKEYWADEQTHTWLRAPLFLAVQARQVEIAALLLKHGADPTLRQTTSTKKYSDGRVSVTTALHEAASNHDVQMVKLLLASGADVNARDWRGKTPLHAVSSFFGKYDVRDTSGVVDALIAAGASLFIKDEMGQIPLAGVYSSEANLIKAIFHNDDIVYDNICNTIRESLINHHVAQNAQAVADAHQYIEALKVYKPDAEWRVGLMVENLLLKSGNILKAGDVVLLHPSNNVDESNLAVVRLKPPDELQEERTTYWAHEVDWYDKWVLEIPGRSVVDIDSVMSPARINEDYGDG